MKKFTSIALSFSLVATSSLEAGIKEWSLSHYESMKKEAILYIEKKELHPITFDFLYPIPFYKTGVFKWGAIIVVSVAVGVATIYTGGAASVPGATLIGGMLGSTWTAGLATLGGGTLASGGFGMAGGALVIATTTDVMIAGLGSFAIAENKIKGRDYSTLKIPLPKYERGSDGVVECFHEIEELQEKLQDSEIDVLEYEKTVYKKYKEALSKVDIDSNPYDTINGAILAYNLGQFELAQYYHDKAFRIFPSHSSFLYYQQALLDLVDNKIANAMANLDRAIVQEPEALTPYLLKAQLAMDNNQMRVALETVEDGLKNYDDENFQLNYLAGRILYSERNYSEAIEYFEEALANTTINEIEAECKVLIAKCYKNMGEYEKATSWYEDALSEVDDDTPTMKQYEKHIQGLYNE